MSIPTLKLCLAGANSATRYIKPLNTSLGSDFVPNPTSVKTGKDRQRVSGREMDIAQIDLHCQSHE